MINLPPNLSNSHGDKNFVIPLGKGYQEPARIPERWTGKKARSS
jgi:hypothetical protein